MPPDTEFVLEQVLQGLGIPLGSFMDLIDQAIREDWGVAQFSSAIYSSDTFHNLFPGIFRPDGSLKMSPLQYRSMSDQYNSLARTYGVDLDKARIGHLISGDVSAQELTDRLEAVKRLEDYKPAMEEFKQVLAERGIKGVGDGDLVNFMLGKAPKQFYSIWEETQVGTAARTAGVHLKQGLIRKISNQLPGVQSEAQVTAGFQDLAQKIQSVMPESQYRKMGVTKKDLVELEFGGPHQAAIAEKVTNLLKTQEAFFNDPRATSTKPIGSRGSNQRAQKL
jgi:hypothetical protein